MDKLKIINLIKDIYSKNQNIMQYLKSLDGSSNNSLEDIMISYDFQAGSYIKEYKKNNTLKQCYCDHLSKVINNLGEYNSILEAGIGEATTLGPLLLLLKNKSIKCYGFDISWSRIKYARKFLEELELNKVNLFTGDLFSIPLKDKSIDIVYTSHSIEPNGGREKEALQELYRITNKYLILLEPSYELADDESRKRMLEHGYITNLYQSAKELGYNIVEYRLFGISSNPLNPTGIMIIQKDYEHDECIEIPLCCPITKTSISEIKNSYYSSESFLVYPIIDEIPCLLPQNAILATKFL